MKKQLWCLTAVIGLHMSVSSAALQKPKSDEAAGSLYLRIEHPSPSPLPAAVPSVSLRPEREWHRIVRMTAVDGVPLKGEINWQGVVRKALQPLQVRDHKGAGSGRNSEFELAVCTLRPLMQGSWELWGRIKLLEDDDLVEQILGINQPASDRRGALLTKNIKAEFFDKFFHLCPKDRTTIFIADDKGQDRVDFNKVLICALCVGNSEIFSDYPTVLKRLGRTDGIVSARYMLVLKAVKELITPQAYKSIGAFIRKEVIDKLCADIRGGQYEGLQRALNAVWRMRSEFISDAAEAQKNKERLLAAARAMPPSAVLVIPLINGETLTINRHLLMEVIDLIFSNQAIDTNREICALAQQRLQQREADMLSFVDDPAGGSVTPSNGPALAVGIAAPVAVSASSSSAALQSSSSSQHRGQAAGSGGRVELSSRGDDSAADLSEAFSSLSLQSQQQERPGARRGGQVLSSVDAGYNAKAAIKAALESGYYQKAKIIAGAVGYQAVERAIAEGRYAEALKMVS